MKLLNAVYRFINYNGEIIYIGKAKNLRQRLASHSHLPQECYDECHTIEFCLFKTEDDMDFAERYFIPKVKPKFNTIFNERELSVEFKEFEDLNWFRFGTKEEIELQFYLKEPAPLPIFDPSLFKSKDDRINLLKHKRKFFLKQYDDRILSEKELFEQTETIDQELFQLIHNKSMKDVKWSKMLRINGVFTLEELLKKDIKRLIKSEIESVKKSIEEQGWFDVTQHHFRIAQEFRINHIGSLWDSDDKKDYLLDLELKGLEDGCGTAYVLVNEIIQRIEIELVKMYGDFETEIILSDSSSHLMWDFKNYIIPKPLLIKRPIYLKNSSTIYATL